MNRRRAVDTWLFSCLVESKVSNITFAFGLYLCLLDKIDQHVLSSLDLTNESRKYWFQSGVLERPMEPSFEADQLESQHNAEEIESRRTQSSLRNQQKHLNPARIMSDTSEDEMLHQEFMPAVHHYCIVYGCVKRFENKELLQSHLSVESHDFRCPEHECAAYAFENHTEFKIHVSVRHQPQEWKLFLPPEEQAQNNRVFDDLQVVEKTIPWSNIVKRRQNVSLPPRVWD